MLKELLKKKDLLDVFPRSASTGVEDKKRLEYEEDYFKGFWREFCGPRKEWKKMRF